MTSEEVVLDPDSPTVIDQVFSDGDLTIADQDSSENALLHRRDTIGPGPGPARPGADGCQHVVGVCCPRDHLNDPRDDFCRTCGLPLVPEPPRSKDLGRRSASSPGTTVKSHELLGAALVGRDVSLDGAVVSGELAALVPSVKTTACPGCTPSCGRAVGTYRGRQGLHQRHLHLGRAEQGLAAASSR